MDYRPTMMALITSDFGQMQGRRYRGGARRHASAVHIGAALQQKLCYRQVSAADGDVQSRKT